MMTYATLKQTRQAKYDELFSKIGLFWAFGNEQFDKNKTPLEEGFKYASIGSGGYFPGQNKQAWNDGMDAIRSWEKQANAELKKHKAELEKAIMYELHNHEAFYTGDIDDVVELFKGQATRAQIRKIFNKNFDKVEL